MSLTVRHLNGDATFLLLFSPEPQPTVSNLSSTNSTYSILIDPWITGSSIINSKWFAVTERVAPSAISHLSELDEPDVVICSQNKPDHTHKETLLQLKSESKTIIAAEPGAAKEIKSWNYFDPHRVVSLTKYDPSAKFGNSLRLYIPPLSSQGLPGEVVISFIPAKHYMTGLHNAIGITYQAPTRSKSLAPVPTIDLPRAKYFHLPLSPLSMIGTSPPQVSAISPDTPMLKADSPGKVTPTEPYCHESVTHRPQLSRSTNTASSELLAFNQPALHPPMENLQRQQVKTQPISIPTINIGVSSIDYVSPKAGLPTPPDSPGSPVPVLSTSMHRSTSSAPKFAVTSLSNSPTTHYHEHSRALSNSSKPFDIHPARPKVISVLYTPHGIATSDLKPYVQNHLVRLAGALPLTLLLHSFEYAQNPWYLGGNIMTGAAGGIEIAKTLMARCWISAHDEPKDKRGVSVKLLKQETMPIEEVRREIARDRDNRRHGWMCDVRTLACGKDLLLSASERDLLTGSSFEGMRQGSGLVDLRPG